MNDFVKSSNQKRVYTADLLKGLAVIAMIQVHITELFIQQSMDNNVFKEISLFAGGPPAAPVFMILMGFFIAGSSRTLKHHLSRGTWLFIGGIFLNILLNASLLVFYIKGLSIINPWHYILGADILPLAGMSTIILGLLKHRYKKSWKIPAFLIIASLFLNEILPSTPFEDNHPMAFVIAFVHSGYNWSYFPILPWLIYPLTGYVLHIFSPMSFLKKTLQLINRNLSKFIIIYFLFLLFTTPYITTKTTNLKEYYHHGFNIYLWIIIFLAGYSFAVNILSKRFFENMLFQYFSWLGRNVTRVYVIQWVIIGNIATHIYRQMPGYTWFLWFPALLAAVSAILLIYNRNINRFFTS